jgi:uncharacterized protein (TIGR00369 family)
MSNYLSEIFKEIPDILSILGYQDCYHDKESDEWVVEYLPSKNLTHSNGKVVQGGFVSGMVDSAMSQFIIYLSRGKEIPLTLDLDVKFLKPCIPDILVTAKGKIKRKGKSVIFTSGEIYQNNQLIAIATATNKIIVL